MLAAPMPAVGGTCRRLRSEYATTVRQFVPLRGNTQSHDIGNIFIWGEWACRPATAHTQPRVAPREAVGGSQSTPDAGHRHTQRPNIRRRAGQAHRPGAGLGIERQACLDIGTRNAQLASPTLQPSTQIATTNECHSCPKFRYAPMCECVCSRLQCLRSAGLVAGCAVSMLPP